MRHPASSSGRSVRCSMAVPSRDCPIASSSNGSPRRDAAAESAFAALVARHGPMVLHVCRQLLGDHQHAEDAFQAVFLVLARRARSVRDPDRLSNWLYGVALRTARKARSRLARRRKQERHDAGNGSNPRSGLPADQSAMAREQAEILHDEIESLPNAFRLPVVLCYFEGLTLDEAARRLRCPEGTLRSRLARARISSAAACCAGAWFCRQPPWPRSSKPGPGRHPSLSHCVR